MTFILGFISGLISVLSMEEINRTPAILLTRTIDKDHCIRFQSKYYFPVTENGDRRYFARKTDCMVIESFDRQFLANIADKLYLMEEVPKHELVSKEFDAPKEAPKKEKKKYIPPMNHPWRKDSIANYAAKQKHHCGNVIKLIMLEFKSDDISADILF